jgi:hypothetical protein
MTKTRLRTQSEVASSLSEPPPKPKAVALDDIPAATERDIASMMRITAGCRIAADNRVRARALDQLCQLEKTCPESFAAAKACLGRIAEARERFYVTVEEAFGAMAGVEEALLKRADLLAECAVHESELREALATLESPASLKMTGEQLIVLEQRRKHLPATISELHGLADRLEIQVRGMVAASKLDLGAIIAALTAKAKDERGRIADSRIQSHAHRGFLQL